MREKEMEKGLRTALDLVHDGILVVRDGAVVHANPAAETVLKRTISKGDIALDRFPVKARDRVAAAFTQALAGSGPVDIKLSLGPKAGELRVRMQNVKDLGPAALIITLQREADTATDRALLRTQKFTQSLVDSSLDMIIAVDHNSMITEFNPAAVMRFGHEREEVIGRHSSILYYDTLEHQRIHEELDRHGAFAGEVRNVDRDGRVFTSFLSASRQFDPGGELIGSMGVSRDVTQARLDREALAASEDRYRDLFENASDLIQSVDMKGRFLYVNSAWKRTLGYSDEEVEQCTLWDIIDPAEKEHCKEMFDRLERGSAVENIRTVLVAKDGRRVRVAGSSNVRASADGPISTRSILRDISSVEEAKEQVQQHVAKLNALYESSDHLFWTVDRRIALTSFNRGYADMIERLYGQRPELNRDSERPRKLFAPQEYHDFWRTKYETAFSGVPVRFETDLTDRSGGRVCNEIFLSPVFGADGVANEVFGVGHEITEQKMAQEAVRDQGARLKAIFENAANMMIWTMDGELRITQCNDHFVRTAMDAFDGPVGVGDLFGEVLSLRVAGGRSKSVLTRFGKALRGEAQQFEVEFANASGRSLWLEMFLNPIVQEQRVAEVSCLAYDISDKKDAQRKLLDNLYEKEVLLKEVHHRVKNNLQIISSILSLQSDHVNDDPRVQEMLKDSQGRIRSMSFIHESLYQNKYFSSVDLAEYIRGSFAEPTDELWPWQRARWSMTWSRWTSAWTRQYHAAWR